MIIFLCLLATEETEIISFSTPFTTIEKSPLDESTDELERD